MITGFACPNCSSQALTYVDHGHGVVCTVCRHKLTYGEVFDMEWPGGDPLADGKKPETGGEIDLAKRYTDHPGDRLVVVTEPGGLTAAQVDELLLAMLEYIQDDVFSTAEQDKAANAAMHFVAQYIKQLQRVDATPKKE